MKQKQVMAFALAAGLVAGCMGPAERDGGLRADGGVAFTVRREELTPDVVDVEIHADVACAEKGDAGYAPAQRGLVFDFNRDDLTWIQHRGWIYLPYYAMKTAKDVFVAVLEGMRFEHDLLLARNGRYEMFPRFRCAQVRQWFPKYYNGIVVEGGRNQG